MNKQNKIKAALYTMLVVAIFAVAFTAGHSSAPSSQSFKGGNFVIDEAISGKSYPGLQRRLEFLHNGEFRKGNLKGRWERVNSIVVVNKLFDGTREVNRFGIRNIRGLSGYLHYDIELGGTLLFLSGADEFPDHMPVYKPDNQ